MTFHPEKSFFEREEFEKSPEVREPWKEEFETKEGNKIEISFSGKKREAPEGNYWKIDSLKIITPQKKSFDFVSLLPKGWHFVQLEEIVHPEKPEEYDYFAIPQEKEVAFRKKIRKVKKEYWPERPLPPSYEDEKGGRSSSPWGQVIEYEIIKTPSDPKFLFTLLHEIGHSWQEFSPKYVKKYEKLRIKWQEAQKLWKPFSIKERRKLWKYVIAIEREAWAYGLKQYRKLKKEGINILPEVKTNKEILKEVESRLGAIIGGPAYHFLPQEIIKELKKKKETISQKIVKYLKKILER